MIRVHGVSAERQRAGAAGEINLENPLRESGSRPRFCVVSNFTTYGSKQARRANDIIGPVAPACDHCEGSTAGHAQEAKGHPYGPTWWRGGQTPAGWLCCECEENARETESEA